MNVKYIFMDFRSLCEILTFLFSSLELFSCYIWNDSRINFCGNFKNSVQNIWGALKAPSTEVYESTQKATSFIDFRATIKLINFACLVINLFKSLYIGDEVLLFKLHRGGKLIVVSIK